MEQYSQLSLDQDMRTIEQITQLDSQFVQHVAKTTPGLRRPAKMAGMPQLSAMSTWIPAESNDEVRRRSDNMVD